MYRPNNNYQIPTTRKPLGIGLQVLGSIEDHSAPKWEIDLSEKADSLIRALEISSNPVALLKSFLQEIATISQHDFYKRASKYLLEYIDTDEFDRAFAYTGLEEFNLNVTKQLHDKPLGRLYIFLKEHKQAGLGMIDLLNPSSPSSTNMVFNAATSTNTNTSVIPTSTSSTTTTSGWDSWGKDVFGGLTDLLKTGVQSTGSILTGVSSLNTAKAAQDAVNVQRQSLLQQQTQYEQLLAQQKSIADSNNQSQIQQYNAQLQQAQQQLALQAQSFQKSQGDVSALLQTLQLQKQNGNTDPNLQSTISMLQGLQNNLKTDTSLNTALQQYTNPNFSTVNSGNSGINWTKIALIAGGVLSVGGVIIYLATRKRGGGLKGVDDVSTSTASSLGSVSHKKRKSYKAKKRRALSLAGINLDGVDLKS